MQNEILITQGLYFSSDDLRNYFNFKNQFAPNLTKPYE